MPRRIKAVKRVNPVRASREGDQFHYLWAARRCLLLLSLTGPLKAITIEGASPSDAAGKASITAGEEVIDLAEYYGAEDFDAATRVRYVQVKHSTVRVNQPWTASGLEKTVRGFAQRFKQLVKALPLDAVRQKVEFGFVSNRSIGKAYLETIEDAASGASARHPAELRKLETATGLSGNELPEFCKLLSLEADQAGLWDQRNILTQDISFYLADADVDAPTQLKELVTIRALSDSQVNPTITRLDVLRALKTDERGLFPAPCLIQIIPHVVPREQEPELFRDIAMADGVPVIVHAAGGLGKSVVANRIGTGLPAGSMSVVYDCFGNGQYRSATGYRHRHKDALVQIANELSARGLCHPLIPTQNADNAAYMRAFLHRLRQSVSSLRAIHPEALLGIVIDAADNAQMAAEEIGEVNSFVRDLVRETVPDGVRFVAFCRTHRQHLLNPPPSTRRYELRAFSEKETADHLRASFPGATDEDVQEFHRLTSQNPRVQALALSQGGALNVILRRLGPNPTTVDDVIGSLLDQSIAKLRDSAGAVEKSQVDKICAGLAALRPLIPISVLSGMSGVESAAIKSFAYDLGRPLVVSGDTIQFFDEPAETWFRDRFKPSAGELVSFISELKPLAASSAYVAAALPQLMLEAGHFDELVALALSTDALPEGSPLERRDVELQRLQFALKASLRAKRYTDAAKLALKAGGESAGDERQRKMLQENTDLTSAFMDTDRIQEIVSRRTFGSGWIGSHHAYEAGLMSGRPELLGDARSRLRMGWEWILNWSRLSKEERKDEQITDDDIAEVSMAFFNIHGAEACAENLGRWKPRQMSFRVGRILARRFVDHGRYNDLDDLALAAGNDIHLLLAIILELRQVCRAPCKEAVKRAFRLASNTRTKIKDVGSRMDEQELPLLAVLALVEATFRLSICNAKKAAQLLNRYLPKEPPKGLSGRFGSSPRMPLIHGYTLRAALTGEKLELIDLAHPDLRKEMEKNKDRHHQSRDEQEFNEDIGALFPWHSLWAAIFVKGLPSDIAKDIKETLSASSTAAGTNYRDEWRTSDEIAKLWLDVLILAGATDSNSVQQLKQWSEGLRRPLFTPTLGHLARVTARTASMERHSLHFARRSYDLTKADRSDAEQQSSGFIEVARAVLVASPSEAAAYFDEAIAVASKIGDENLDRWGALLDLADRAAVKEKPEPELAYRLARSAELTYGYVVRDKHFDWGATVRALAGLCPSSSLAILSRWRDRQFGWPPRLLPKAVDFLVSRGDLNARTALGLIGFRADWNVGRLLGRALAASGTQEQKQSTWNSVSNYIMVEHHGGSGWRDVQTELVASNLVANDIGERASAADHQEAAEDRRQGISRGTTADVDIYNRDWKVVFGNDDLGNPNAISAAYARFKATGTPYSFENFFKEAIGRVRVGHEAEFIRAIADVPEFGLYDFRNFLDQVPDEWRKRLATKAAFESTLRKFCRRYCMEITKSRYYEVLPFKLACELSGIPETAVVDEVIEAIGETTEVVTAGRLFTLVGLLAMKLSHSEAAEALSFSLNLLEGILEPTDGDGAWRKELEPPRELDAAVAGYVLGTLASPFPATRWEAAHVVRILCALGESSVVDHLVALVKGKSGGPFVDAGLDFYGLHAQQWLLIGLARAALQTPKFAARYAQFLTDTALQAEPHVLIRQFAKRGMLALIESGEVKPEDGVVQRLAAVNVSPFPAREAKSYARDLVHVDEKELPEDDRYYFGIDFGPYWLAPLGRIFSMAQSAIERAALDVIRKDWGEAGKRRWSDDERHRRKLFRDMETYHHHGSAPQADDSHFYVSYHALMVVAGKLLSTVAIYRDPDYQENEFDSWLASYDLTRPDGRWLADRRDPAPAELASWKTEQVNDEWLSSISKEEFDRVLRGSGDRICLWGDWKEASSRYVQQISIYSALVSTDRSMALARALETTYDPHDYRIPDAEDDLQIDFKGYQLKGWVVDRTRDRALDESDPWAGGIRWPAPRPASSITKLMNLHSDPEGREWKVGNSADAALLSKVWGDVEERKEEEAPEHGDRLDASPSFISQMLRKLRVDLILKVEIQRRHRYSRFESSHEKERIPPSARLFIVRADGSVTTVAGGDSARQESGRRTRAA